MKLATPGRPHLTYCTNIHPGEAWAEVRAALERHVPVVKAEVAPDRPFGVGLRLSADAARSLDTPGELEHLRALLADRGLYVFTLNGFPYGAFHGTRVKEAVYLPDWLDPARLDYTDRLARLLAAILPDDPDLEGSVSTVPGAFRDRVHSEADGARMAELLVRHVATLHQIRETTGRTVTLALEPEPACHLETVADAVGFFERHLVSRDAVARLGHLAGLGRTAAEACLRCHLGVCFDACHMAVEFEDAGNALDAFRAAGIRILKVQLSAGLEVALGDADPGALDALTPFAEGVYLHQVVERRDGTLVRYLDLPEALARATDPPSPRLWRIHFHVPLFLERLGPFRNTQPYLVDLLGRLAARPDIRHLEVETYTWEVLPAPYRREAVTTAIARELRWVLDTLGQGDAGRPA